MQFYLPFWQSDENSDDYNYLWRNPLSCLRCTPGKLLKRRKDIIPDKVQNVLDVTVENETVWLTHIDLNNTFGWTDWRASSRKICYTNEIWSENIYQSSQILEGFDSAGLGDIPIEAPMYVGSHT